MNTTDLRNTLNACPAFARMTIITPTDAERELLNEDNECTATLPDGRTLVLIGQTDDCDTWAVADQDGDTYVASTFDVSTDLKDACRELGIDEVPDNYAQSFAVTF